MTASKRTARPKRTTKRARKSPRKRKTPICPECGADQVIPVIHSSITPSLQHSIDAGRAILADREEWEGMGVLHALALIPPLYGVRVT